MTQVQELDEQSLEKLAWIIAEEFVDGCETFRAADDCADIDRDPKMRLIFAWGDPAATMPKR